MPSNSTEYMREWRRKNKEHRAAYAKWYRANKTTEQHKQRERDRTMRQRAMKEYGITLEEYKAKLVLASGKCSVCGRAPKRLVMDHDHRTNKARAFVCDYCNFLIGIVEGPYYQETLPKVKAYLELWVEGVENGN